MTTIELQQEKFNLVKELTEISGNISLGQANLLKLKQTTEEYLIFREKKAEERVLKVLRASRDALEETSKNHQELSSYSRDLKEYAGELTTMATDVIALFKDFNARVESAEKLMDEREAEVNEVLKQIKIERVQVSEDRKQLARERKETAEGFILLKDREAMLERGFKELNNKKNI